MREQNRSINGLQLIYAVGPFAQRNFWQVHLFFELIIRLVVKMISASGDYGAVNQRKMMLQYTWQKQHHLYYGLSKKYVGVPANTIVIAGIDPYNKPIGKNLCDKLKF